MLGTDLDTVERGDGAIPNDPEALRLEWLRARAMGCSLRPLLDLIGRYFERGFSIPEIDVFIDERSRVGHDPMLAHALAMAAELEEIRTH